jgi:hypothetical protein
MKGFSSIPLFRQLADGMASLEFVLSRPVNVIRFLAGRYLLIALMVAAFWITHRAT